MSSATHTSLAPSERSAASPHLRGRAGLGWATLVAAFAAVVWLCAAVAYLMALVTGGSDPFRAALYGAVGGAVAIAAVAVLVPAVRRSPAARARQRLIDAASPVHPLMKRLMAEAPGTYVHSLAVANLAEAGAEAIGADPLVARVGAYYHDVGKLAAPCFFFENQQEGDNPHDEADPSHSADIITAHVRDGLALAAEYRLPPEVVDVIREHHGTSLVRYFYHKAAERDAAVYEADFRYRGGRPHSREAAVVMLADSSEASVRAMTKPDTQRIERSVRSVIAERRADGQLDDVTLGDDEAERLIRTFVRNLVSQRHVRCPYPDSGTREES